MKKIVKNILETIGSTPLVKLEKVAKGASVFAKCEFFNPGGSIKDRVALNMVEKAFERGEIKPGATLIEATSGNTGIGLAMIAASMGLNLIIVMPETMSIERRKLIAHFGALLHLTPGVQGMSGAVKYAEELHKKTANSMLVSQFTNPDNPGTHLNITAMELLDQTDRKIDIFVAGVGTGGTISGIGKTLKKFLPHVEIIAVEPTSSAILSGGVAGPHQIQGIGAGFIPKTLDTTIYSRVITCTNEDAIATAKQLARQEGILCGISSGANVWAALKLSKENPNKNIITLLPDTGERYLSTALFD